MTMAVGESYAIGILVVDDEPSVLHLLSNVLTSSGYRVVVAASAVEGLQAFERNRAGIELIISDIIMPEMNGVEMASRILALEPAIAVLFISGDDPGGLITSSALESAEVLPKPLALTTLLTKVRQMLYRSGH